MLKTNPPEENNQVRCLYCKTAIEFDKDCVDLCPECFDKLEPIFLDWAGIEFGETIDKIVEKKLMKAEITINGEKVKPIVRGISRSNLYADILT